MISAIRIGCLALSLFLLQRDTNPLPLAKNKFIVVAHRGDHTAAPENTLAAYENAIRAGADYVEIDLRTSSDGQLLIMHDASIDRMTNEKGKFKSFSFAYLRALKVQDKQHPEWGVQQIPTFDEVLQKCKGKINIYLDFKDADVKLAYEHIRAAGMEKSVVVYINEPEQLVAWHQQVPQMPLMVSLPRPVTTPKEMHQLLDSLAIDVLDGDYTEYTPALVNAALQKNIPIWADIQSPLEGPAIWNKGLALHLAGLQTDHPAALVAYLQSKGMR